MSTEINKQIELELHDGNGALIATNNDWQTTQIGGIITSDQSTEIQNSSHAPSSPKESAHGCTDTNRGILRDQAATADS